LAGPYVLDHVVTDEGGESQCLWRYDFPPGSPCGAEYLQLFAANTGWFLHLKFVDDEFPVQFIEWGGDPKASFDCTEAKTLPGIADSYSCSPLFPTLSAQVLMIE
jgi:hypothetical protein